MAPDWYDMMMGRDTHKRHDDHPSHQSLGHLERELRESLERYELIFKATHDVLYDLDILTGRVVWNEALRTQFGYSIHEPANTLEWWVEHIHPDDAFRLENELSEWLTSNTQTRQLEYRFRKADGSYSYVRDRGLVARGTDGRPVRLIGSLLDITKQKKLDRAKDEFISLVSHQLRTPLTVIRVYGEMLTGGFFGELSDLQLRQVERIASASIRLIGLVDDILHASRIELGDFTLSPELCDARKVISSCIEGVVPIAIEKDIVITLDLDQTAARIMLDVGVFTQVLDNLIANAIRYTRSGGKIHIAFARERDEYILSVRDNGIGIPASAQAHIFDRFYRASNAINITEQGTGLGLYLVQLLATALGGRVWFESKKNRGSTFYFALPADDLVPPDDAPVAHKRRSLPHSRRSD